MHEVLERHTAALIGTPDSFGPFHRGHFPKGMNHALAEKSVHALEYVAQLTQTEIPFVFVGGTAAQLLVPGGLYRLSKDVDVIAPTGEADDWREITAKISGLFAGDVYSPHEDERDHGGLAIPAIHFRLDYPAHSAALATDDIELDVVFAKVGFDTQLTSLSGYFYVPKREIAVKTPTVEAMAGLKLATIGPRTIGIPHDRPNFDVALGKQLFDLSTLLPSVGDVESLVHSYRAAYLQQASYHATPPTEEDCIADAFYGCKLLSAPANCRVGSEPWDTDSARLDPMVNKLRGYVGSRGFDRVTTRLAASRLALLTALVARVVRGLSGGAEISERWHTHLHQIGQSYRDTETIKSAQARLAEIPHEQRPHLHIKDFLYAVGGEALLYWDAAYAEWPEAK